MAHNKLRVLLGGCVVALLACSPTPPVQKAAATDPPDPCAAKTTCGSCTSTYECGWCDFDDGTTLCTYQPWSCALKGRYTPTVGSPGLTCLDADAGDADGGVTPADGGDAIADGGDAIADAGALNGEVRILASFADDLHVGAAPVTASSVQSLEGGPAAATDERGDFTLPLPIAGEWLTVFDPSGENAETIARIPSTADSFTLAAFPTSLLVASEKSFGAPAGGATVVVRVNDTAGRPLAAAHATPLAGAVGPFYDSGVDVAVKDATDREGTIVFFDVPPGAALLRVDGDGGVVTVDVPTRAGAVTELSVVL